MISIEQNGNRRHSRIADGVVVGPFLVHGARIVGIVNLKWSARSVSCDIDQSCLVDLNIVEPERTGISAVHPQIDPELGAALTVESVVDRGPILSTADSYLIGQTSDAVI